MNILFLSLGKFENPNVQGIYTDLLREFKNNGHKVYIVSPRERKFRLPTGLVRYENMSILKVKIGNIEKTNILEKGFSTLRIQKQYISAIKYYFGTVKFDLILYTTPPITIGKVVEFIKHRDGAKTFLLLKDIFPQNAIDLKLIKRNGIIHKYFSKVEHQLYQISDYIGTMSPANTEYLLTHNSSIDNRKVCEVPNTLTPANSDIDNDQKENIRRKYNIPINKIMAIYGGNLGKPQGIDNLLRCLLKNESNDGTFIVIVGSGTEFTKIHNFINVNGLKNCLLLDSLPKAEYDLLVNSADIGLIFLDVSFTIPNFPSRLLSYLQASIPIIASTDISTDIGMIAEKNEFGLWNLATDINHFNNNLLKLENDQLRVEMGWNGRKYLENNYTSQHAYEIIMNQLDKGEKNV